jgi:Phytanoyl-CoA dioxygenase (PhyH)
MAPDTVNSVFRPAMLRLAKRKALTARKIATRGLYHICRRSDFTWRYMANLRPLLEYQWMRKPLRAVHEQLLGDLRRDGIVITSVGELMGNTCLFEELESAAWKYEGALADEIGKARMEVDTPGNKSYLFTLLGHRFLLNPDDIFVRFTLQPEILDVVNSYFGMLTRLRYYDIWHTFPTQAPPRQSQLWHRDPEDRYILKMFVYLTDVDEGAGPLSYAPGTHAQGAVKTAVESQLVREGHLMVRRSDDAQVDAVVPKEHWITAIGPRGTVVLVDTRGYHKGGLARERERILFTCMFNSQAGDDPEVFERKLPFPNYSDKAIAFAIGC